MRHVLAEHLGNTEANAMMKKWFQVIKPDVDAIDAPKARKEAATLAQRVVNEYPKVELITRIPDPGSSVLVHRAKPEGETRTYAGLAEALLYELKNLSIGQIAPDFEGQDAYKRKVKLSELRGKVVVLTFSANWCLPCKKTYPTLQVLRKKHPAERLEIVAIMADQDVRTVKKAQEKNEITWRALWDGPNGPIARQRNVQTYSTIYVLDSAGVIRARHPSTVDLPGLVAKLLAESAK